MQLTSHTNQCTSTSPDFKNIAEAIVDSGASSYEIGYKYQVSPYLVRNIGTQVFGEESYNKQEQVAVDKLKSRIEHLLSTGVSESDVAKSLGITILALKQVVAPPSENITNLFSEVIEDEDDKSKSSQADNRHKPVTKSASRTIYLKYNGLEVTYDTERDAESSIIAICVALQGVRNATNS